MSFISNEHAQKISDWEKKHPQEAEAYWKEHRELSEVFCQKKISYTEFKKQSDEIKTKYKFLE
jgi:hypothetical protein